MSQSTISSFFKRKSDGPTTPTPAKKPRIETPPDTTSICAVSPLSDRTKRWHIDSSSEPVVSTPAKKANHEKFVDKLGDIERTRQQKRGEEQEPQPSEPESEGSPDEVDEEVSSTLAGKFSLNGAKVATGKRKPATKNKSGPKLTPLEIQVQKIQEENPSTILMVEVGYKYRFFGPDARTASQILGIAYFKSHSFLTASVPTHRLQVHVNRLVKAGKKVGVVRQIETAALKAVGDNRNKTFERRLCEVYSKGTYLGDNEDDTVGGWILSLTEEPPDLTSHTESTQTLPENEPESEAVASQGSDANAAKSPVVDRTSGSEKDTSLSLVAIRVESGEVVYDTFMDNSLRSELEKRLLVLDVIEIVTVGKISSKTRRCIQASERRVEETLRRTASEAKEKVREFYISRFSEKDAEPVLGKIMKLPDTVLECLFAQIKYLAEFKLESIFTLTNFFQPFENKLCMQLPATTVAALEIFHNTTDGSEKGTLFWVLNHTKTLPGKRLLKRWISRPLVHPADLMDRQGAVEEIVEAKGTPFTQIEKARVMLKKLPDLEKGLSKIFYGKCTRPEVLQTLQAFSRISRAFDPRESFAFKSPRLKDTLSSFSSIRETIEAFLGEFNHVEAAKDDKFNMFKESDSLDSISDHKMGILIVESDLRDHLKEIGKILKRKVVEYVSVAGVDFLIELKNDATKLVPKDWIKMSGTKYVSRFHSPTITRLIAEREQRKELLAIECDKAFRDFLKRITDHYETLRWIVASLAELDCLLSLATLSADESYTKPTILPASSPTTVTLSDSRHPIIEKLITGTYIPNNCTLSTPTTRAMLVSGPNMGGKSSYIKQIALICIMTQIGCYVPCSTAKVTLLDAIFCRMGASDNALNRQSTFMVELSECAEILNAATRKSLVIVDELGRGTSTFDGLAIAWSVLSYFLGVVKCLVLFVTHYPSLADLTSEAMGAWHMGYLDSSAAADGHDATRGLESGNVGDGSVEQMGRRRKMGAGAGEGGSVTFLYTLCKGMADSSYGLNVARLSGLPASLVSRAAEKARLFEIDMERRERERLVGRLKRVVEEGDGDGDVDGERDEEVVEMVSELLRRMA